MACFKENHTVTEFEDPRYPQPIAAAEGRPRAGSSTSQHSKTSGFSWFRLSADGRPWGPVDELSLYIGTAFSSIPDEDDSSRSPNSASWSSSNRSTLSEDKGSQQYVVDWNKPNDLENPTDWTVKSRWVQVVLVSILTLQSAIASSMPVPAVPDILREFKSPEGVLSSLIVSIFNLGVVFGSVFAAPISELYGRYPVYSISNVLFLACNVACAVAPNIGVLLTFRFLSGFAGAGPLSIGGSTLIDIVPSASRGQAVSLYCTIQLLGPVLGPAAGGFLAEYAGWRWIFWVLCVLTGIMGLITLFLGRETSDKTLLEKRTRKTRERTGDTRYISALDEGVSPKEAFSRAIKRPFRLLILHPIVSALSFYFAVVYGYLYLLFTTFPAIFSDKYGFSASFSGHTYLGIGIGVLFGLLIVSFWSDRIASSLLLKKGVRRPEFCLPLMTYSAPLVPVGLLLYGWTAENSVFWLVPMIGTAITGAGVMFAYTPLVSYLVDAFTTHAASALTASTIFRSIFGTFLPLVGPPLYSALGLGWGNTILAAFAFVIAPIPWIVMKRGQSMRDKYIHCVH